MAGEGDAALVEWLNNVFDKSFVRREEDVANLLKHLLAEGTCICSSARRDRRRAPTFRFFLGCLELCACMGPCLGSMH